jgi:hypothetical protein
LEPACGSPHFPDRSIRGVLVAAEEVRARLRRRLAGEYGMDEADLLLDRPSGGWDDLVTKDWLHLELTAMESRFAALEPRFAALESRLTTVESRLTSIDDRLSSLQSEIHAQTWKLIGAMAALIGALVAAIKL